MTSGSDIPPTGSASRRVLLVEDDAGLRSLIVKHLEAMGCQVDAAATAESAHAILSAARSPYHVLIADVHLPDGTGLSVARAAHETQPNLPLVFITGDGDARVASEALRCDPAGYLLKPFELTELDAIVLHLLHAQPAGGEANGAWQAGVNTEAHARAPLRLATRIALILLLVSVLAFAVGYAITRATSG